MAKSKGGARQRLGAKVGVSKTSVKGRKAKPKKRKKRRSSGSATHLQQPLRCSTALASLLTESSDTTLEITRAEAVKQVWAYANQHNLKSNGKILCDTRLRDVFGVRELEFGTLAKALSRHLEKASAGASSSAGTPSTVRPPAVRPQEPAPPERVRASPELSRMICEQSGLSAAERGWVQEPGTGGGGVLVLPRADALRWLGDYIRLHKLRTTDKMHVKRDAALWHVFQALPSGGVTSLPEPAHLSVVSEAFQRHLRAEPPPPLNDGNSERFWRRWRANAGYDKSDEEEEASDSESEVLGSEVSGSKGTQSPSNSNSQEEEDDSNSEHSSSDVEVMGCSWAPASGPPPPFQQTPPPPPSRANHLQQSASARKSDLKLDRTCPAKGGEGGVERACPASVGSGADVSRGLKREEDESTAGSSKKGAPSEFVCPITMVLMREPMIAMDGHSYERAAIELWLKKNKRSPLTNEVMPSKQMLPNHNLRKLIDDYIHSGGAQ